SARQSQTENAELKGNLEQEFKKQDLQFLTKENILIVNKNLLMQALDQASSNPLQNVPRSPTVSSPRREEQGQKRSRKEASPTKDILPPPACSELLTLIQRRNKIASDKQVDSESNILHSNEKNPEHMTQLCELSSRSDNKNFSDLKGKISIPTIFQFKKNLLKAKEGSFSKKASLEKLSEMILEESTKAIDLGLEGTGLDSAWLDSVGLDGTRLGGIGLLELLVLLIFVFLKIKNHNE
ncbi:39943_t:CDS:2, partial [Gigaspora margarita]